MKPNSLFYLIVFVVGSYLQIPTNAQDMYVKADSFVYANDEFIFINNDLELNAATSTFYLRNDAQLLQGTTASGANKGIGSLSVFQEGTVNNFQFNYWCSPVGNVMSSTSVNNPFGITQLKDVVSLTQSNDPIILGPSSYDGAASPLAIAPFWINRFQVLSSSYSDWIAVGSTSTINPGEGFTMKGSSGINSTTVNGKQNNPTGKNQRYDFRGKPNDGAINIPVLAGEWSLAGNPYPSAIDLQAFLIAETKCSGIAYFWEQDKTVSSHLIVDYKGGYGVYSSGPDEYVRAPFYSYDGAGNSIDGSVADSGGTYNRRYAPIGQGFMIEGIAGGNVQMKNSYRRFIKEGTTVGTSIFEKKRESTIKAAAGNVLPRIRFNTLLDNGPISQMILVFDPESTDGNDRAKDASNPNDGPANTNFVINDEEFIIMVMPFDINKKTPIGFRNYGVANYKITVNEILNLPEVTDVFLHDKKTDLYYDIKNSFYDLTLAAGTNNTQFEITFKNGILGIETIGTDQFLVRQDNTSKKMIISNPSQIEIESCSIYDITGKMVYGKSQLGNSTSYDFPTSNLSDGIYIVKLQTNDKIEWNRKVIVKN